MSSKEKKDSFKPLQHEPWFWVVLIIGLPIIVFIGLFSSLSLFTSFFDYVLLGVIIFFVIRTTNKRRASKVPGFEKKKKTEKKKEKPKEEKGLYESLFE